MKAINLICQISSDIGDKLVLPQSVLQALLDEYGDTLPTPLIFSVANRKGVLTHAGIREFTADEGFVVMPEMVAKNLKVFELDQVTIGIAHLGKCTALSLEPTNNSNLNLDQWKALLEAQLRSRFTAVTKGDTLLLENQLSLVVQDVQPAEAVCIVDTDVNLNVNVKTEGYLDTGEHTQDRKVQVKIGKGVTIKSMSAGSQRLLEVTWTDRTRPLLVTVTPGVELYVGVSALATNPSQFLLCSHTGVLELPVDICRPLADPNDSSQSNSIFVCLKARSQLSPVTLKVAEKEQITSFNSDSVKCTNCNQLIPQASYTLHAAVCLRKNVLCPHGCGQIFDRQAGVPDDHWHCNLCSSVGNNTTMTLTEHVSLQHTSASCSCGIEFPSKIQLAAHKARVCPLKLHTCRFCQLQVPQGKSSAQNILEQMTGHEADCGAKTADCEICHNPIRLRDLNAHLRIHDLERLRKRSPAICANVNCTRPINSSTAKSVASIVDAVKSLCDICYGPLHTNLHDPQGQHLQRIIERKYILQLTRGCGRSWCDNQYCSTGNPQVIKPVKELIAIAKNLTELATNAQFFLCVDEMTTRYRMFVRFAASEGSYSPAWCSKAISESRGNESEARKWLGRNAVKLCEVQY